jgi:amino acid adenylation domain-containing protein
MLLHHAFEQQARRQPEAMALSFEGRQHAYGELHAQAKTLAAQMQACGVQRGDRVATLLENSVEAVLSVYAALMCGAVIMPVNPLTKGDKLAWLLNDARASLLIAHSHLQDEFRAALKHNTHVHTAWVVGEWPSAPPMLMADARLQGWPLPRGLIGPPPTEPDWPYTDPGTIDQDLAAIIYTSGSTGDPKGVMLSHLNMVSAARSVSQYLELHAGDVIACALPLAFDYGLYQILMAFSVGARVVLERSFAFPARVLSRMADEGVTVLPGVPTLFSLLLGLKTLGEHPLPALRALTNTAAALPEAYIHQLRQAFPRARLFSMYGLTECKRVTYLPPEQLDTRPTSVGRGMPNEEVWLVDGDGQRLPHGSTGELVVRGSHVMRGYWEKPEQTAKRLKPGPLPGEMVLYSGDIFRTDAEGYLYFVARKDDIIKSRGEKVSPREVENALYAIDGVREAAVVGVPDPVLGQAVKAYVALRDGTRLTEREVIRHCLNRLESFMAPKYVTFVEDLPKTDTGKIKKTGLV